MGCPILPPGALQRGHPLKRAGVKKVRKKKEEKGEEESDKDPSSKLTKEPRKKKESLAPRSQAAKGSKKPQGAGATPTPLQAPRVPCAMSW